MKKTLLLVLAICWSVLLTAGDVTPEKALQQATDFMNQRVATGSRRASMASQELTMTEQVSGLYVFNIANDGGFVIVSNDDSTTPILGYADSGNFDPNNIPDNMKAWLQGYADEIAWAKSHHITAKASNRAASAVKTPIAPLVQTKWDQESPYYDQCPDFFSYGKCVTGCVATAMAQIMYYTATKAGDTSSSTTAEIKSYDCKTYWGELGNISVSSIPAGTTLEWSKMNNTYSEGETGDAATAVALLMRACGASVNMEYANKANRGSSSNSPSVPTALKTYFGYDATTQYVDRSFYSYSNWIELLYNELSQERAILYSGQSSGGGHAFVCDGYQGEDFFHINWGWGGSSDGHFKLSALNPTKQGAGGSSSSDGYNYGQSAIVGIQLYGGTGTVIGTPNTINLSLNSITASKTSITTDESIDITFNITNNSSDDYDGETGLFFLHNTSIGNGKMFYIPAGETKDCVVSFKPSSAGTYKITAYVPNDIGKYETIDLSKFVDITVTAGSITTSDNVDLNVSLTTIENSNVDKTEFYGKKLNAVITFTNPSTTTNYKGTVYVYLKSSLGWRYFSTTITVPAGGKYDFIYSTDDITTEREYYFTYKYQKNSVFTAETQVGSYFTNLTGIFIYNNDGSVSVDKPSGSTYDTPSTALAVDLSGTGITTVTKNSNPNCLYIFKSSDAIPTSLTTNVIKGDEASYTADNITLTDGSDFYSPVDFTAKNIEFTYSNDRWADGTKGWNTIILPFDVTSVTANGTAIDWFKSSSDTGKQFWLKEFTSDEADKVNFDFAAEMKANTPYIIALPGSKWGEAYNLTGKTIKFIGNDVLVGQSTPSIVTASNYRFVGNTQKVNTENIYCINSEGSKFSLKASGGSAAFRPFFKAGIADRFVSSMSVTSLAIGTDGGTTGIELKKPDTKMDNQYYDLNGHRVLYPRKGVYILNGKKIIIK